MTGTRFLDELHRGAAIAIFACLTIAVPVAVIGTAVVATFQPWIVDTVYSVPGFPGDPGPAAGATGELDDESRRDLARAGVRSVAPLGPGAGSLRELSIPGDGATAGSAAFNEREVAHMADVEDVVGLLAAAWATAVAAIAICLLMLQSVGRLRLGIAALGAGGFLTLLASAAAASWMLIDFDSAFRMFHEVAFDPGTWTFSDSETLRRIYPDAFWSTAAIVISALVIAQAAALVVATGRTLRFGVSEMNRAFR